MTDQLPPGPELDRAVAEEVMEWKRGHHPDHGDGWRDVDGGYWQDPHEYSTDIAAAWEVMEKVKTWIRSKRMTFLRELQKEVSPPMLDGFVAWPDGVLHITPHAICLAALAAVRSRKDG